MNNHKTLLSPLRLAVAAGFCLLLAGLVFAAEYSANGWTYYSDKREPVDVRVDKNLVFDSEGRLVEFDICNEFGDCKDHMTITYSNCVYDEDGNMVSCDYIDSEGVSGSARKLSYVGGSGGGGAGTANSRKGASAVAGEKTALFSSRSVSRLTSGRMTGLLAGGKAPASTEISYNLDDAATGKNSGDAENNWSAWLNGAYTRMANSKSGQVYDGYSLVTLVGLDRRVFNDFILGAALGLEYAHLNTTFNNGDFDSTGMILAPYLGWAVTDNIVFDLTAAFTFLDNYQKRRSSNTQIGGGYGSNRWMISANLNYLKTIGNWNLGLGLGYLYTQENINGYTESGGRASNFIPGRLVYVGEIKAGGRVGYFIGPFEPYVGAYYFYDHAMSGPNADRDEVEGLAGFNLAMSDLFLINFEAANSFFREDLTNTRFMLNLRCEF